MANPEHLDLLRQGVDAWNSWRLNEPSIRPDLSGASLSGANLSWKTSYYRQLNLREANLSRANLSDANLSEVDLSLADLNHARLHRANLRGADFRGARLFNAKLGGADLSTAGDMRTTLHRAGLSRADLTEANLSGADLSGADLIWANLTEANLSGADLNGADLSWANLSGANLSGANLEGASLMETNLVDATLTDCRIYGISAWNVKSNERTKQQGLIITPSVEPAVTIDDLEVAQFVYLLLHNEKVRHVIDTITSKVVLILGRFTPGRKAVLDAIREELRRRAYVPILFDSDVPATRDITETVSLLARMARFIVADLTDPSSIPKELEAIVPQLAVPVQPVLEGDQPYAMFKDYWKYDWVLPVHRYESVTSLLGTLTDKVIAPAETKMNELADKRRRFEAELIQPR